jgi:hypothetical protein
VSSRLACSMQHICNQPGLHEKLALRIKNKKKSNTGSTAQSQGKKFFDRLLRIEVKILTLCFRRENAKLRSKR